jgi:hypothetical protein
MLPLIRNKGKLTYPCMRGSERYSASMGSPASLTDLHAGAFTVDGWYKLPQSPTQTIQYMSGKGDLSTKGWYIRLAGQTGLIYAKVYCQTTIASVNTALAYWDDVWHFIKMTYDNAGDRKIYVYIDNVLDVQNQNAGVGSIVSDVNAGVFLTGKSAAIIGLHGWVRWSNIVRDEGILPRGTPPAIDANTVAQWNVDEGSGDKLNDASGNNNQLTLANEYTWTRY